MFQTEMKAVFRRNHPSAKKRSRQIHRWIAVLSLATVICGAVWWHISLNPRLFPVIENQVYRSAQLSASRLDAVIEDFGIRTIIALMGPEKGSAWYENEKAVAGLHQIQMLSIGFGSHELPQSYRLNQLVDALLDAPSPILLHCRRGSDRTGMASAIAMILKHNASIETIEKQFSWQYGVIPFSDSIGILFFNRYRDWLSNTGKSHSRELFLDWIRNHYVDHKGNIAYDIRSINGRGFDGKDIRVTTVQKKAGQQYVIQGWAVDPSRLSQLDSLQVGIEGMFREAVFTSPRPELPDLLDLSGKLNPKLPLAWECTWDNQDLSPGCHFIQLAIGDTGAVKTVINTRVLLCIKDSGK